MSKSLIVGINIFQVVVGECQDLVHLQPVADGNQATIITGMIGGQVINWADTENCLVIILSLTVQLQNDVIFYVACKSKK